MNWLKRVEPMYSNIFTDIHLDDRRMRKHLDDEVEVIDTRPSGPDAWDLIQMAQADKQWAAYLALNPDPITGLLPRDTQEQPRPLPKRDRPLPSRYDEPEQNYYWDYYGYRGTHGY